MEGVNSYFRCTNGSSSRYDGFDHSVTQRGRVGPAETGAADCGLITSRSMLLINPN